MFKAADNLIDEVLARVQLRHTQGDKPAECPSENEHEQRLTEALTQSVQGVFETMCGFPIEPCGLEHGCSHQAQHDLNGIISISGKLKVTVVLSLTKELAFNVVTAFLGAAPDNVNSEVLDVVGEMTNMICGNAKERLSIQGLSLGLPTVVTGSNMIVAFESGLSVSRIAFDSPKGAMSIVFGARG